MLSIKAIWNRPPARQAGIINTEIYPGFRAAESLVLNCICKNSVDSKCPAAHKDQTFKSHAESRSKRHQYLLGCIPCPYSYIFLTTFVIFCEEPEVQLCPVTDNMIDTTIRAADTEPCLVPLVGQVI